MGDTKPFKRKRKENFRRRTLKFSKRGKFGHGTHIEQDMFDYFCRVVDVQKKGFDSDEEKVIFANNVLDQAHPKEVEYACNQIASWALEAVIPLADCEHLKTLEDAFSKDLRIVFVDRFGSHVTQKLIEASAEKVKKDEEDIDGSFCMKCCKFALNNLEEFSLNTYATHVVRTCLATLGNLNNDVSRQLAKLFYGSLIESPVLLDLVKGEVGSCLVQSGLQCLQSCRPKLCQKAVTRLTDSVFSPEDLLDDDKEKKAHPAPLPPVFTSTASLRLLECAIECASGKRFTQLYAKLFINRMVALSLDRQANLAVQKLLKTAKEPTEFEAMFDELSGSVADITSCGHVGVVESLATTCQTLGVRQGEFINALMKALGCSESEKQLEVVLRCLALGAKQEADTETDSKDLKHAKEAKDSKDLKHTKETKDTKDLKHTKEAKDAKGLIGLQGSLIVQRMLSFKKPIKIINSLLAMDTSKLVQVFNSPRGSFISDAFFKGEFVGEKSKDKLFKKLQGRLVELVVGKHGSRAVERVWEGCVHGRDAMMAELSRGEATVVASQWGAIVASKLGLAAYRHDKQGWAKALAARQASTHLFKDIIGQQPPGKEKKDEIDE